MAFLLPLNRIITSPAVLLASRVVVLLALPLVSPVLAQDTITNVMSPVVSYQYYASLSEDTNSAVVSPVVSYQFYDLLGGGTNAAIISPVASYQYFEWPGNGILQLLNSPLVSYFYATVGGSTVVSTSLSRVLVSPGSLPADGQSPATVTVRLLDGNGNPVAGKTVRISAVEQASSGGVATLASITQSASLTDSNGQATATLTSAVVGTAIISAQDVTDGVSLLGQPTVQFGSALVAPGSSLANAIAQLSNSSGNLLTHAMADDAMQDGAYGDYFRSKVSEDKISEGVTVLDAVASALLGALGGEGGERETQVVLKATKPLLVSVGHGIAVDGLEDAIDILASSSSGLTTYGQTIAANNTAFQQAGASAAQRLLSGVLPITANYTAAYVSDIALRMQADAVLEQIASSQRDLNLGLKQTSDYSHTSLLKWLFKGVDATTAAAEALVPAAKPIVTGIGAGEAAVQLASEERSLSIDQQGYNSAFVSLTGCSYLSSVLDANTESALNAISLGRPPAPVTGSILSVDSKRLYVPASGIGGSIVGWLWSTFANTKVVQTVGEYSAVTIRNTGPQAAQFGVYAFFVNTVDLVNDAGINVASANIPIVAARVTSIPAGQSVQVTLDYFNSPTGGMPDGNGQIAFSVLGYDGKNGAFAVDQASSTMLWQQAGGASGSPPVHPNGPFPEDDGTNMVPIETLIRCLVSQSPSNQTYQAQVWVVNPFAIPLLATVTQPLPPGATVISTDGVLAGDSIVWTNTVATNGLEEQSFSFRVSVPPGAQTNLPPPTVVFSDGTGTNSLTQTSAAVSFVGLFPVGVSSDIPSGTWGVDTRAQVIVTNYTPASQTGWLAISVTDANGNVVTNFSLTFSVGGLADTNLSYTLPGTLAPGAYVVTGILSMGGGSGQVLSGTYVVDAAAVWLECGPASSVLTDGFTLQLHGTEGLGYLIQSSTNLVDWQPVQYVVLTNSSVYFTDYYAPFYSRRFYRAVPLSQAQSQAVPPVVPRFGAVGLVSGGGVQVTLMGGVGQTYTVQASTNLVNWVAVTNLVLSTGAGQFTDYPVTNCPQRFYRAVVP